MRRGKIKHETKRENEFSLGRIARGKWEQQQGGLLHIEENRETKERESHTKRK